MAPTTSTRPVPDARPSEHHDATTTDARATTTDARATTTDARATTTDARAREVAR